MHNAVWLEAMEASSLFGLLVKRRFFCAWFASLAKSAEWEQISDLFKRN